MVVTPELNPISTQGWLTSVAGENVIDNVIEGSYTVKNLQYFSIVVKESCYIKINDGKKIFIDKDYGYNHSPYFKPASKIVFEDAGIDYYILAGY